MPDPAEVEDFVPFDDFNLVPYDQETILGDPDQTIELVVNMGNLGDGAN
jgi:iron transport multicopper oxidase